MAKTKDEVLQQLKEVMDTLERMDLQSTKKSQCSWNGTVQLSDESKLQLEWWIKNLPFWNGRSLIQEEPSTIIYTDVSNTGWCILGQLDHPRKLDSVGVNSSHQYSGTEGDSVLHSRV
ncbi:unnamed protein product [Rhizophagus irregularis]|nr:unnamed protein product [Rhizophagus irregularis]